MSHAPDHCHVVLIGRQGAGKGVQSAHLVEQGYEHLSTGAALRREAAAGTALGRTVEPLLRDGALVPDELVAGVVAERLRGASQPVVLDGFPRTEGQAELLESLLEGAACQAVHLDLPREVALARLARRRVCPACDDSTTEAVCARCDLETVRRPDDEPEAIARRLDAYDREAGPLLAWFADRGRLVTVDADGSPADVAERIARSIGRSLTVPA